MVLASVYATGQNSSATLRPASIGINRRVTTQENSALSGNDCGGQAEVLVKGVAARGIDRFLPPYSYTIPSFRWNGDLISFGTVGRQVVGGASDASLDRHSNEEKQQTKRDMRRSNLPIKRERTKEILCTMGTY